MTRCGPGEPADSPSKRKRPYDGASLQGEYAEVTDVLAGVSQAEVAEDDQRVDAQRKDLDQSDQTGLFLGQLRLQQLELGPLSGEPGLVLS